MSDLNGIINIKKPPGITSFRVVSYIRKELSCKRVGHTGTLDPAAIGVLPICVGKATKLIPYIPESEKEYIAEITLGVVTSTLDIEGEIVKKNDDWHDISTQEINHVLEKFHGTIQQIPPMFSAVHHNGKRLYKLARQGKEVEREPREVEIMNIELLDVNLPIIKIRVLCSKGTYIRTLADDIGKELNVGAHLSSLIRSKSGPFHIEDSITLKELQDKGEDALLPMDFPLQIPKLHVKEASLKLAENGAAMNLDDFIDIPEGLLENRKDNDIVSIYFDNQFISINRIQEDEDDILEFKPLRVFNVLV